MISFQRHKNHKKKINEFEYFKENINKLEYSKLSKRYHKKNEKRGSGGRRYLLYYHQQSKILRTSMNKSNPTEKWAKKKEMKEGKKGRKRSQVEIR